MGVQIWTQYMIPSMVARTVTGVTVKEVIAWANGSSRASGAEHYGRELMSTNELTPGLKAEIVRTVDDSLVVRHMGGDGVLSTPNMIGLMERAGIEAVQAHLPEGHTTVGFEVHVKHFGATPKGKKVTVTGRNCSRSTVASSASRSRRTTRTRRSATASTAGAIIAVQRKD